MSLYRRIFRKFSTTSKPPREQLAPLPTAPPPKRVIGFRGNHQHNKPICDPVYPTSKIPSALVPRFPIDWRNAGRFILSSAMAKLENKKLFKHSQSLRFQRECPCGNRCGLVCRHSPYRCLCVWRSSGSHSHVSNIDSILMTFKGVVKTKRPIFSTPYMIAKRNTKKSVLLAKDNLNKYTVMRKVYRYSAFNTRCDFTADEFDDIPCYSEDDNHVFDLNTATCSK